MKALFKDFSYYEDIITNKFDSQEKLIKQVLEIGFEVDEESSCLFFYHDAIKEYNVGDIIKCKGYYAIIEHKSYDIENNIIEYIIREE
ncbi:MAG: hypothetical protein [Caudoviricetes sp.]|nr:MAG: hypothetical protein [Caudoviricetes sp.]